MCVLIVDDNPKDLLLAARVTRDAGFQTIDLQQTLDGAKAYLETALKGERRVPDAILLDLSIGADSGYELLRIRYGSPALSKIRMIVWSEMDGNNREISGLFKADAFVGKWTGAAGLRETLADLHLPVRPPAEAPV